MKQINYFFLITFLFFMISCNHDDKGVTTPDEENVIKAFANFNPDEPIIIDVTNDKGESIVLMGTKTASGHAEKLQQMVITIPEEENPTEVFFDDNQRLKEMIAPNGVRFLFDWISDIEVALTLIDPNTNEQLNTLVDLSNQDVQTQMSTSRSINVAPRTGNSTLVVEPINESSTSLAYSKEKTRASSGITGNVYLEQCGAPATAQCWVDVYDRSNLAGSFGFGKYRGRFACTKVGEGHYQFQLPNNYNAHHNVADYCDAINSVINKVCGLNAWTAPGSGAKQYMCLVISGTLASGIVTAPVAAGFLAACEAASAALDVGCLLITGYVNLVGTPTWVDGLCGILREMDYTWDTPLVLQPVVNALPSCIYGMSQIYEADGTLKDMKITWGGYPVINSFRLEPSAPAEGVSYQAIAELYCLPSGTEVTMDIIGTDGYTDSQTSTVNNGENVNYRATLWVPGAESGVMDVCTVYAVTPNGETVTKKASLVFQ